jgi:hypothetical protein
VRATSLPGTDGRRQRDRKRSRRRFASRAGLRANRYARRLFLEAQNELREFRHTPTRQDGTGIRLFLISTTDAVSHIAALVPPGQSSARPRNDGMNNGRGHLRHVAECHDEAYPSCPLEGLSRRPCDPGRGGERQLRILTSEIANPWHLSNHGRTCGQLRAAQPNIAGAPQRTGQKPRFRASQCVRIRTRDRRSSSSRRPARDRFESRDR